MSRENGQPAFGFEEDPVWRAQMEAEDEKKLVRKPKSNEVEMDVFLEETVEARDKKLDEVLEEEAKKPKPHVKTAEDIIADFYRNHPKT
ncbi:TPA: hypothetical protein DD449_03425 [Candidatus Berkelbacteria bacterium]|uniref:Uncharacterized protein n=1 Tax=Berkelbacteria bacterium GW2011_GWE1_39_12 TaxID=1618337 RepID=A0A0G4B2E0_9BACT|nr:MAG: hypothetical protein UT28_C0001G0317 [Berkelbacteria bacterium GW2011_GWE1_39_12]HBO60708.1 hypothetical protein [Candidatus Berkelbacteria bacterium]